MSSSERDDLLRQIDAAIARIDKSRPASAGDGRGAGEQEAPSDPADEEKQALSRWRWGFRNLGGTTT
jgi:hypothetical protein